MPAMAMGEDSTKCATSESSLQLEIERCHREITEVERLLLSGHPDVAALCMALADWSAELRILERERERTSSSGDGSRPGLGPDCHLRQLAEPRAAGGGA